jgi:hypothetical protein
MFARKVANSSMIRGLHAKCTAIILGKGSDDHIIITMQNLGQSYPKFVYGMAYFEFGLDLQK